MIQGSHLPGDWRRFLASFALVAVLVVALLYVFVLAFDPYGLRTRPGRAPTPLMDLNQRYMYPQLIRSGLFDAAIFGTSTMRLIEPHALGAAFDARLANLGMNAATPWEQTQLAALFLRHVPAPKLVIFGLDRNWCAPDADARRLTFRTFPPWLYKESRLAALPHLLNLKSLEIAARVALNRLGLMPARIRQDGYEVFTPPEASYDLARARAHIAEAQEPEPSIAPLLPGAPESGGGGALRFPALDWLDGLAARLPAGTRRLFVLPPIHVSQQARPGSREGVIDSACKARIAAIGARRGATTVDFRFASPITLNDSNYWDPLHYRLGIAARVATDLATAARTSRDAPDGDYRVLTPPAGG